MAKWKKNKKKSHSAVLSLPGCWTGNNIFCKGGLIFTEFISTVGIITWDGAKTHFCLANLANAGQF